MTWTDILTIVNFGDTILGVGVIVYAIYLLRKGKGNG